MSPKMTNDIEHLSLTLHDVNGHFLEWPPIVKITKGAISDSGQNFQKQNQKIALWRAEVL